MHVCVLNRTVEVLLKANSPVFFSLCDTHSLPVLPAFGFLVRLLKRQATLHHPTGRFFSVSHFQCKWLANMGNLMTKKDTIGFFGQSCFLERHCLLSAFFHSVWTGSMGSRCRQLPTYSVAHRAHLPCFESHWTPPPHAWQAHWSSGLLGHGECTMQMGEQGTRADSILHITPLLHHLTGFHLQNRSSRWNHLECQDNDSRELNQAQGPSKYRVLGNCTDHMPMKPALVRNQSQLWLLLV